MDYTIGITMIQALLAKYATKIISVLFAVAVLVGWYYYWKHDIVTEALTKQSAKLTEQSDKLLKQKNLEVQQAKDETQRRALNAISIYAAHAENMRVAADAIPNRVFIAAKTSCSGDTVPRAGEGRPKATPGPERVSQAELPQANIRELNKTISMIEAMQLKCERLLNEMP